MKRSLRSPPFKLGLLSNSGLQSLPFQPLNITYNRLKRPNGEMDEGNI